MLLLLADFNVRGTFVTFRTTSRRQFSSQSSQERRRWRRFGRRSRRRSIPHCCWRLWGFFFQVHLVIFVVFIRRVTLRKGQGLAFLHETRAYHVCCVVVCCCVFVLLSIYYYGGSNYYYGECCDGMVWFHITVTVVLALLPRHYCEKRRERSVGRPQSRRNINCTTISYHHPISIIPPPYHITPVDNL